ncbi:DUF4132 domain-containing protein [Gordonia sp. TBRC 11910]|uniref:DUF4132 domain-containing protein n=1 Tax=Gordonia asplenii TaxID=2725283 RepID=A0A848L8D8_9ACTN|nr:DUF4132 domain-containing protein [Gordonia asplenii]NMO03848.1 DUF4132 domain-containing protein [Gordonia asplenii]
MAWFGDRERRLDAPAKTFLSAAAVGAGVDDDRYAPDLARRLTDYLETGADAHVLAELAQTRPPTALATRTGPAHDARRSMYAQLDAVPADWGVRWATILDAYPRHPTPTLAPIADAEWAESLVHDIGQCFAYAAVVDREPVPVQLATLDAIVVAGGGRPGELLEAAFSHHPGRRYAVVFHGARSVLCALSDYPDVVARYAPTLVPLAASATRDARDTVLKMLDALPDAALAPFAPAITAFLVADNAKLAVATEPLAARCRRSDLVRQLRTIAADGSPAQQLRALRALWRFAPETPDRAWAIGFAATATSAAARALAREWGDPVDENPSAPMQSNPITTGGALPPTDPDQLDEALRGLQKALNAHITAVTDEWRRSSAPRLRADAASTRFFDDKAFSTLTKALRAARTAPPGRTKAVVPLPRWNVSADDAFADFAASPAVEVPELLTALGFFGDLVNSYQPTLTSGAVGAVNALYRATGRPTLAELADRLTAAGHDGAALVFDAYRRNWQPLGRTWADADVAGFVAANLDAVVGQLGTGDLYSADPTAPFAAIATLPSVPDHVADPLYRIALGTSSRLRTEAQDALARDSRRRSRILAALTDPTLETRAIAAAWLARISTPDIADDDVAALDAAYRAERSDKVRQGQLDALAELGRTPDYYLNRQTLAAAVRKGARRGPATVLAWLNWDALPELYWLDDAEPVDIDTVQWLLSDAAKAKSPQPSVATRYYWSLFTPASAQRFGDALLDFWMSATAIKAKGVLAVCATTCRVHAAPLAEDYIRTYYGLRAAECKALLAMLAQVDDPSAAQVLLSIGKRFRTKGIQLEAVEQTQALAARMGWSAAELADRTVPDAGFTDAALTLDFGSRAFTARLTPDASVAIFDDAGNRLKNLPAPRVSDDSDAAAQAKRELAAARKAVKSIVKHQTERLYDAMCTARIWSLDDWRHYVAGHPIVGLLAARLVWMTDAEHPITFRPLDDGSLTDAADAEITLSAGTRIRLAHTTLTPLDDWPAHFTDYDVTPLFGQFAPAYAATDPGARSIDDYTGAMIDMFTLRSAATKRGYTKGDTLDGGIYLSFDKHFPTLGITASIGFSGTEQPVEDLPVALTSITFTADVRLALRDVPAPLLAETVADAAGIAERGSGFEPDWRKEVRFA